MNEIKKIEFKSGGFAEFYESEGKTKVNFYSKESKWIGASEGGNVEMMITILKKLDELAEEIKKKKK